MNNVLSKLDIVRGAAKALSVARAKLAASVAALTAKVDAAHRKHIPIIRERVGAVADAEANLRTALRAAPEHFVKPQPRTIVESGIKCGYQGHDASLELPTDKAGRKAIVEAVEKMFTPQQIADYGLLATEKVPVAAALLAHCSVKQREALVKLGAEHVEAGDHVLIKSADAAIDKYVAKLLKAASDTAKEGEAA
jgi:hypothetical protein